MKKIHFISLGCPKNRVDSEVMLGAAQQAGWAQCEDPSEAEVIVINTCGFIDAAKKESIDTILAMADYKEVGRCERLVVAGCLSQRHPDEMAAELPEVDHFLGSSDMLRITDVLSGGADRVLVGKPADWVVGAADPRTLSSSPGSAYVKIAEGCDRQCSFCVIPDLRGKQRSRRIDDVTREVTQLVGRGVREVGVLGRIDLPRLACGQRRHVVGVAAVEAPLQIEEPRRVAVDVDVDALGCRRGFLSGPHQGRP